MPDIPQSIILALQKSQEKVYLLHLERELISFIKRSLVRNNGVKITETYTIQAIYLKNSYYRLLSHQLCSYYRLQHWNNSNNEIIVSGTDGVHYDKLIRTMERTMENNDTNGIGGLAIYCSKKNYEQNLHKDHQSTAGTGTGRDHSTLRPKMLIKKGKLAQPKKQIASPEQNTSDTTDGISVLSPVRIEESTPISSADTSHTNISKIESERASKEALYMQIREKIFQDGQDDDIDDEDDEETGDSSIDNQPYSTNPIYNSNEQYTPNGYNMAQNSVYPYPQVPMPIPLPIGYNNVPQSFPSGPYFNPTSVPGPPPTIPPYVDYYIPGAPIMPPTNNYYNYGPIYDKETERRLLNNPYIIIPDEKSYEKKPRRNYRNNRHLPSDQKMNIPSNESIQ